MTDEKSISPATAAEQQAAKSAEVLPLRAPRPCPNCGQESSRAAYPFCSKRCADVDLNRWLSGRYAIPVADTGEEDD